MEKTYLQLNTYQEATLRKSFEQPAGPIRINRENSIGKFICSQVRFVKQIPIIEPDAIEILLPKFEFSNPAYNYATIYKEGQKNIADYLQATFDINIELFFVKGYRLGYLQKDIVESFMAYYNIPITIQNFEMIKKRDFRKRKNVKKIIANFIASY